MSETVLVVGASPKADRYSNKAIRALVAHGHRPIPVHPLEPAIEGIACVKHVREVTDRVDTVTLYVNPARQLEIIDDLISLRPGRVIFNPGTENAEFQRRLTESGVPWEEACTLVLLSTRQF